MKKEEQKKYFTMINDLYKFLKVYRNPIDDENWWHKCIEAANVIHEKNSSIAISQEMVYLTMDIVEEKCRKEKKLENEELIEYNYFFKELWQLFYKYSNVSNISEWNSMIDEGNSLITKYSNLKVKYLVYEVIKEIKNLFNQQMHKLSI